MQIFISWSGERSRLIAEAIRGWLPKVVQSVKPWMSDQDISAGARWLTEVSATLNTTNIGIICVTPENQHNPWLLFEAGALSKTLEQTCVCPLVFEMTSGQLTGPLTQFQANVLDRDGIGKVLSTINKNLGDRQIDPQQMEEILDVWWPKLQEKLDSIPAAATPVTTRTSNDQLEELLTLTREQLRRENIRIEASREKDEKFDSLLGILDKARDGLGALQGQAQRMGSIMNRSVENMMGNPLSLDASPETVNMLEMVDAMKGIAGLSSGQINVSDMQKMSDVMRDIQKHDQEFKKNLLTPPEEN